MIDMTFFVCLINPMFHLNKIIMKDLLFKKSLLVPFLLMFALLFSSCDKDKDEQNGDKSLDVTVNFTGSKKPKAGDVLNVVVIYTKISELDLDNYDGPDFYLDVPLTQSDIDNGVTVSLDMIDLTKPEIYVGALVDMDDELGPSPGDLIEFFDDVDIIDAMLGVAQPTNCHGKKSVKINLDKVMTLPSLDVTVNFTGTVIPEPGQMLYVSLFYSPLTEFDTEHGSEPDIMQSHILTADDIENGKTLTLSDIDPSATEAYVGAFVDTGDDGPGEGELIECYENVDFVDAVNGDAEATNVIGKTAITIDLDMVLVGMP